MKIVIDTAKFDEMFPENDLDLAKRAAALRVLENFHTLVPGLAELLTPLSEGTCSCRAAAMRDEALKKHCLGACHEAMAREITGKEP